MQEGHSKNVPRDALADLCDEIRETYRRRVDVQRAETRLTLQIKSICRRLVGFSTFDEDKKRAARLKREAQSLYRSVMKGEGHDRLDVATSACLALLSSRAVLHKEQLAVKRRLEELVQKLPVWEWCQPIRGFAEISLANIVGEAGDLSKYDNPAKLWKRMGVGLVQGAEGWSRQRKITGDAAIEHGYSPSRRAVLWQIGANLIMQNDGEFRALYDSRKVYEVERAPDMKPGHAHNRAKRYMEKRLLRELWRAWRATDEMTSSLTLPAGQSWPDTQSTTAGGTS